MLNYFTTVIQPEMDKLNDLLANQIRADLRAIQASATPSDEELGF